MSPTGKSVLVSFRVRVVRACERARRRCVRLSDDVLLNAGGSNGQMCAFSGVGLAPAVFNAIRKGFKGNPLS